MRVRFYSGERAGLILDLPAADAGAAVAAGMAELLDPVPLDPQPEPAPTEDVTPSPRPTTRRRT